MAEERDEIAVLSAADQVLVDMVYGLDPQRQTEERNTYYDGYANGVRAAQQALRAHIMARRPDFHDRVAEREKGD